jgi:hypothetical protein
MESSIFFRPEVLRVIEKYVEVRLHTDKATEASRALAELKLKRLDGEYTLPAYEIVDPKDGRRIDLFRGADPGGRLFAEFLAKGAR